MDKMNEDHFLKQIDRELRSLDIKLKKVISHAQALLREYSDEVQDGDGCHGDSEDDGSEGLAENL